MFDRFRKDRLRQHADKSVAAEEVAAPSTEEIDEAEDERLADDASADDAMVVYRGSLAEMLGEEASQEADSNGVDLDHSPPDAIIDASGTATEADVGNEARDESPADDEPDDVELGDERSDDDSGEQWPEEVGPPKLTPRPSAPPASARRPRHWLKSLEQAKRAESGKRFSFTPEQRLLILDTWQRSGLPAGDFAELVSVSKHTLYKWKKLFETHGPEGLVDQPKGKRRGSIKLSEVTKRTILMLKSAHPDWGVERIADMLMRGPGLSASPSAISRVLQEAGYQCVKEPTQPNRPPKKVRTFERARPNQLWQTDLFTFMLKRQNRRLHLVAFMDDHSRFIVSFGLHASATTPLVIEALEAGIANYGPPSEVLTDNGPQFVTWRGKSRFTRQLEKRGIKQLVARPRRPQTLGKVERFWGTLWRELIEGSVMLDLADARQRIGHFIDYYNFQRTHRGIDGLVPADRFFGAAPDVLRTLKQRVAASALELARGGNPKAPFYVIGNAGGQSFSVHAEGERLVLNRQGQQREEIELADPSKPSSQQADAPMPTPLCPQALCPQAIIDSMPGEPAEAAPSAPGQSAIDEIVSIETQQPADGQQGGANEDGN